MDSLVLDQTGYFLSYIEALLTHSHTSEERIRDNILLGTKTGPDASLGLVLSPPFLNYRYRKKENAQLKRAEAEFRAEA